MPSGQFILIRPFPFGWGCLFTGQPDYRDLTSHRQIGYRSWAWAVPVPLPDLTMWGADHAATLGFRAISGPMAAAKR
jgi:hypothetical protein